VPWSGKSSASSQHSARPPPASTPATPLCLLAALSLAETGSGSGQQAAFGDASGGAGPSAGLKAARWAATSAAVAKLGVAPSVNLARFGVNRNRFLPCPVCLVAAR
jgi:hypothetical protein